MSGQPIDFSCVEYMSVQLNKQSVCGSPPRYKSRTVECKYEHYRVVL